MDYKQEIINLIHSISDNRLLAFIYGLFDEMIKHISQ